MKTKGREVVKEYYRDPNKKCELERVLQGCGRKESKFTNNAVIINKT